MLEKTRDLITLARNEIDDDTVHHRDARALLWRVLHDKDEAEA